MGAALPLLLLKLHSQAWTLSKLLKAAGYRRISAPLVWLRAAWVTPVPK